MKLYHEEELVGEILTNRSMTIDECLELLDIDIDEEERGIPLYDYNKFRMEY